MLGLMMDRPLLISSLLEHAARCHGTTEIVSREADRNLHRYTYDEASDRAKRLARALLRLGVRAGDRIASMAWNTHRHYELYYAASGIGAVLHTVNPRLFHEQIRYMMNHAADRMVFIDPSFLPVLERLRDGLPALREIVVLAAAGEAPETPLSGIVNYEALIAEETADFAWPEFDERTASSLCYTSGTTGNPKGALYSHRSTVLHALASASTDLLGLSAVDCVCPLVPMFHVNAWGLPYSATMVGARLVLPGRHLDGESICALFRGEGVTVSAGVPTLWLGALDHAARTGAGFGALRRIVVGGAAAPPMLVDSFQERYGIEVLHAWGMTEMSPLGTAATLKHKHQAAPAAERRAARLSQGRPPFLVELKLVGGDGRELPHDGKAVGELHVRGPWVVSAYFEDPAASAGACDAAGWFKTGDVCSIDPDGYMRVTDRSKDVIKSGGEWISSIALENAALGHPDVAEAAVIGLPHPKWTERPLLLVVLKPGRSLDKPGLTAVLAAKVAKWWLPDDILAVAALPHTATGKILKTRLREEFGSHPWPAA